MSYQDNRLRRAVHEVEGEKWKQVATKVGNGASAKACAERIEELEALEIERQEAKQEEEGTESS